MCSWAPLQPCCKLATLVGLRCVACVHMSQNWGKELRHWLGDRVEPVVVDDTKADKVKKFLQVGAVSPRQCFHDIGNCCGWCDCVRHCAAQ